jgi:hypothetical protein
MVQSEKARKAAQINFMIFRLNGAKQTIANLVFHPNDFSNTLAMKKEQLQIKNKLAKLEKMVRENRKY